ncbi:MAG TPA: acetoin dehydrogenase dihydrolipoyllysine-residue acetyltransferase subunit, partial [Halieaceae bacterium]|nr:acetoin dehydrogenase dihydrolipoyllysine-residue acetyltransferase subunit [Halieaceae bacterium]
MKRLLSAVGDLVPVGQVLAVIAAADTSDDEIDKLLAGSVRKAAPAKTADEPATPD